MNHPLPPGTHNLSLPVSVPSKRGRWQLLGLLFVCLSPILISYLMYFWIPPEQQNNYGFLFSPLRTLPPVSLKKTDGNQLSFNTFRGRWLLVSFDGQTCTEYCAKKLYSMRQVRLLQGENRTRIERLWINSQDTPIPRWLASAHEGLIIAPTQQDTYTKLLSSFDEDPSVPTRHIYLIDPLGHLMMRFPENADPILIKKDLARLLKYSRIG